jgi:hypothetical protein
MGYLAGTPKAKWRREEGAETEDSQTWAGFKRVMLAALGDEGNRRMKIVDEYADARLRPGQSIEAFVQYLDTLEEQMPSLPDEVRKDNLFAKLPPALKGKIMNYNELPRTREQLIALAARLQQNEVNWKQKPRESEWRREGGQRDKRRSQSPKDRPKAPVRERTEYPKGQRHSPPSGANTNNNRRCFNCNKLGHFASECRVPTASKTCFTCKKPGHMSYQCPDRDGSELASHSQGNARVQGA